MEHYPDEDKEAILGLKATNNEAESSFAGLTERFKIFNSVDIYAGGGASDIACNGYFECPNGMFNELPEELQIAIVMTVIEQAPATFFFNSLALEVKMK